MSLAEDNRRRFTQMYLDAYRGDFGLVREILSDEFVCRNPLQPAGGAEDVIEIADSRSIGVHSSANFIEVLGAPATSARTP